MLRLASLFQDHAVLQRDQPIPVWGWAPPDTRVRVLLAGREALGLSNATGEFLVRLPALPAGGPHTLRVELPGRGEGIEFADILVGEVWLASGQSNMAWLLAQSCPECDADIAGADFPAIRVFTVLQRARLGPQTTVAGDWKTATPVNAPAFSAVAYGFARELHRALGVPVGIIVSAWGGTGIQSWTSRRALVANPDCAGRLADYERIAWTPERWEKQAAVEAHHALVADPGLTQDWHRADLDDSGWPQFDAPRTWQAAGHPNQGVFWFRREVEIPRDWVGIDLELGVGAVDKQDITFVNGVEVGRTGQGFEDRHWCVPRLYAVPGKLVTSTRLSIAVRACSFIHHGGLIGPAGRMALRPAGGGSDGKNTPIPLAGPWRFKREHDYGLVSSAGTPPPPGHDQPNTPHILFDNMIRPLAPYALRGAIWYQGESDVFAHHLYARQLSGLIEDWRQHWESPALAFHLVQLPRYQLESAYQPESTWAPLRAAQSRAAASSRAGIAHVLEFGDAADIHPRDKMPVAARLARSALALTYGRALLPCGPTPRDFVCELDALRVRFDHAGSGLATTDGRAPATFRLAGTDGVFHPAEARIEGASVVVSSAAVPAPVAVRYAWSDNPVAANLCNSDGLTAGTFGSGFPPCFHPSVLPR